MSIPVQEWGGLEAVYLGLDLLIGHLHYIKPLPT